MLSKNALSKIVASLSTLVGVLSVLAPFIPTEWKAAITGTTLVINYLLLSPVAKVFGVEAVNAK